MQKVNFNFKKLIAILCLGVLLLLSGLFFVGCNESAASKMTITPDKTSVTLFAGESADVTFTLGNREDGVDSSISFALIDSTVASATSEHVSLQVIDEQDNYTTIRLTGTSGGSTTLVATTNEGGKKAYVSIEVRQYSSSISLKEGQLLYVTDTSLFTPSEQMYRFDSTATERNLTFHRTEVESEINEQNAFVSAKLTYDEETNQYIIGFIKESGDVFGESVVSLGTQINFMARYENGQTLEVETLLSHFTVLPALEQNAIQISIDNQPVDASEGITIVANDKNGKDVVDLTIKVPSYIENAGTDYQQNYITFKDKTQDSSILTVVRSVASQSDEGFADGYTTYTYQLSSATIQAASTSIDFSLFYTIGDESFESASDSAVSQKLNLPVNIRVAPDSIVINGYEQGAPENNYNFYNYYDGDYGWQQFNVEVFRTDSGFDYVLMTFDNDVVVRYQDRLVSSPLRITDISQPVEIRGASAVSPTTQTKQISFEVISEYIQEDNDNVIYNVNYTISTGATAITFDDASAPYEYNENNDNSGIFLSISSQAQIFAHLVADYAFETATPVFYNGDASAIAIESVSADEMQTGDLKTIYLRVEPRRTGIVTYRIMLDNGVSKLITFRVINTFEDLSINIGGTQNDGVLSYEKVEPSIDETLGQISDEISIVMQNGTDTDENNQPITIYGKNATVQLSTSNGTDLFDSITYNFSNINLLSIVQNGASSFTLSTNTYGETVLDFSVQGVIVNQDFIKEIDTKYARATFVSTVSVSQFEMTMPVETNQGVGHIAANSVNLFIGNNITNTDLQTVTFSPVVSPSNAYGFYDPDSKLMNNSSYNQKYIYWTVDGATCFNSDGTDVDRMIYGGIYRIGQSASSYYGMFDTTTFTFTVNSNYGNVFSFTMFASLRQYGGARYFPINVRGQAYDNVTNIYTNLGQQTTFTFSPSSTSFDIAVYLNPISATDKNIVVRYISGNASEEDAQLINLSEILYSANGATSSPDGNAVKIEKVNDNGAWLIKVNLNSAITSQESIDGTLGGTLQIIPNAWFVDEDIVSGYQNRVISLKFEYANGEKANPFSLSTAQDVLAIGQSAAGMKAHYKIETTIDMSAYSSLLPLGGNLGGGDEVFSGSIISKSGGGIIKGLDIKNGDGNGRYGLFSQVSGEIDGVTFEGSINVSAEAITGNNIGLIAGMLTGTLSNITAKIYKSTISLGSTGYIGGLVGSNEGAISNMNVLFEEQMQVILPKEKGDNESSSDGVSTSYIGGIAGYSTGSITGFAKADRETRFGYEAYSVYALIDVRDSQGALAGNAAAVCGYSSSLIANILAGGEIFADRAAGIVTEMTGVFVANYELDITTRVFVRGNAVGLIAVSVSDLTNVESGDQFIIQSTDDGLRTGIYASMAIVYVPNANESPLPENQTQAKGQIAFWKYGSSTNQSYVSTNNLLMQSYVTRQEIDMSASIRDNYTTDQFYGDVVVVCESIYSVIDVLNFDDTSTAFSIKANESNGFYEYQLNAASGDASEDGAESGQTASGVKVINMYYFEAAGSYQGGEFTTSNLYQAQAALDPLNTLNVGDSLYPIIIEGADVAMTSASSILEISSTGQIKVKGTGLARVEISSLLNQKENEVIYFNIINYFNVQSYRITEDITDDDDNVVLEKQTGIFKIGNLTLGQNARFNVFSNAGVDVLISPSYILTTQIGDQTVEISHDGLVSIGGNLIQLAKNYSVSASVEAADANADKILNYGAYIKSRDGLTFVKTGSSTSEEKMEDSINLSAALVAEIDGQQYSLDITTLNKVTINYYEGATDISSIKDKYVLTPSSGETDTIVITSDYSKDELVLDGSELAVVDKNGIETDLFNVKVKAGENSLKFGLTISVDKASAAFASRREQNIYKTYYLNLVAKSNPNTVLKTIEIALHQENVDSIIVNNFPSISATDDSTFVVPGRAGVLSVTLSPIDADFNYVEITNNMINSLQGASQASFVLGTYNSADNTFTENAGAETLPNGIRISRQVLEGIADYQGQFYLRYMFSNIDVVDGSQVAVDIKVVSDDGEYADSFDYRLYKQEFVSIDFAEYPGKTQVARGLSYDLNVQAVGYEEVIVNTTQPQLAQVVFDEQTATYQLVVTNNTIDYNSGQNVFEIQLTATRTNESGSPETVSDSLTITVLEYVINYSAVDENNQPLNQDVITGMVDGTISVAVGDRMQLSVGFEDMIEYNTANASVATLVDDFLNQLTTKGTWTLYTDLNINNEHGIAIHPIPLESKKAAKTELSVNSEIKIPYLQTSGLTLVTYRAHQANNRRYFFTFEAYYQIGSNGVYEYVSSEDSGSGKMHVSVEFNIDSYMRGSAESPNPITTYAEFLGMQSGGYYILLNDIEVPAQDFVPLQTQIAYFDGNNYKFIFADSQYDLGAATQGGLFGSVADGAVLKNITIQVGNEDVASVSFASSSTSSVEFGLVAGANSGSITNASVQTAENTEVFLTFTSTPASSGYYFGGVAGNNSGYITNSRVSIKAHSLVSMGGVVGVNQGTIASSAFRQGLLRCESTYNNVFVMGGLCAVNSENAKIITSYTSGDVVANKVYADGTNSMLNSSVQVGGFVHTNDGTIQDCYSNIPIITTSVSAGFAFTNSSRIERSFSTSKITGDNSATNFYFAGASSGSFEDCYYIRGNNINVTLSPLSHEGVSALTYNENEGQVTTNDFANLSQYFSNYSYSNSAAYNSVWFYSDGSTSDTFKGQQFSGGRLELVSANIIATSQKQNIGTTTNAEGILIYQYVTAPNTPEDGSVFNPYVIYDAESMQTYMKTPNNVASGNYRIINDISYASLPTDFNTLHQVDLRGNLEGNGATISNIQIASSAASENAGMFASISGINNINASVMNLTIMPQEVAFTNANVVGTVAGLAQNANLYNINVLGSTAGLDATEADEVVMVTGKNIVGGVVGLTLGGFNIKNVQSLISAFATYVPKTGATIDYESNALTELSFAGGAVGYLGGRGSMSDVEISRGAVNVLGAKAGLVFGGIARSATASDVFVTVNASMKINAYRYGGYIAGEIKGTLNNAYVYSYGVTGQSFTLQPYVADAIGGITGLLRNGGRISTAYMQQGFVVGNQPTAAVEINTIDSVGGLVGRVEGNNNTITQAVVAGNLVARNTLGGAVGEVAENGQISISQVAIKDISMQIEGQIATPSLGGIIGTANQNAVISISDSYNQAPVLTINTYTYSMAINARVGGIIAENTQSTRITLSNIYSISTYSITVADNTSASAAAQVAGVLFTTGTTPSYIYGDGGARYFAIGQKQFAGGLDDWKDRETTEIVYSQSQDGQITCANVYNSSILGTWTADEDDPLDVLNGTLDVLACGYTNVIAKKHDLAINIYQNEFGTDLFTANKEKWVKDGGVPAPEEGIKTLYNKFVGNPLWQAYADGFSELSFEQNLLI